MASKHPTQVSDQEMNPNSLTRAQRQQLEDNPLLQSLKPEAEPKTARLALNTKKSIMANISSSFGRWWLELLSFAFAIGVFLTLALVLRPYHGQVLSSWPLKITINTFVAICALLIKVSLEMILSNGIGQLKWVWYRQARPLVDLQQYDSASRGVFGSLGLLWNHRGRQTIPALGAFLTILLTLFDPFGQALVRLENCTIIDPFIRSTIATTHHADLIDLDSPASSATISAVTPGVIGPMMIGMLNESLIPSVPFDCPTGNCTYPKPYHSSGYCSQCSDVSDQVTRTNDFQWRWEAANFNLSISNQTISISGNGDVMAIRAVDSSQKTSISSIQIMASQLTHCENNSSTPWGCRTYGAATCEIYPCVISYTGEVNVGTLKETITNTSAVWSTGLYNDPHFLGTIDVSCLNTSEMNALQQIGFDVSPDTKWLAYNESYVSNGRNLTINETIVRPECLYATDLAQIGSISSFFSSVFDNAVVSKFVSMTGIFTNGEMPWQAIWNQGNLDFINVQQNFDGLAEAMTYYARNSPTDPREGVVGANYWNGTSYRDTACIQIQWQWITYPATAIFGAMIFLFGTMVMTRTTLEVNGQDYKTSILPLMFHGIAFTDTEESFKQPVSTKEMTAEAKDTYVKFEATEKGWQFVEKKIV